MQFRQILLVHPSRAFRGLIKKFVFAEFNDVQIAETDTAAEALQAADNQSFSAVLAGGDAGHETTQDFTRRLKESLNNAETPVIVLCEDDCGKIPPSHQGNGFDHVVHIRHRPADLIRKLNEVCNPRQMRRHERFHLPNATVFVTGDDLQAEAKLINISRGGVLVEMHTYAPQLLMKSEIGLSLHVSTPAQSFDIKNLRSKLLRLYVTAWHADNTPVAMRVTFLFTDLELQTQNLLQALLQQAQRDQLEQKTA